MIRGLKTLFIASFAMVDLSSSSAGIDLSNYTYDLSLEHDELSGPAADWLWEHAAAVCLVKSPKLGRVIR